MARIAGVDLPKGKRIEVALTYLYGIGPSRSRVILGNTGVDPDRRAVDLTDDDVAAMAVADPTATVQSDIERLRQAPGAPDAVVVSGLVYDVRRGTIEQVVATGPLRASQVASDQVR